MLCILEDQQGAFHELPGAARDNKRDELQARQITPPPALTCILPPALENGGDKFGFAVARLAFPASCHESPSRLGLRDVRRSLLVESQEPCARGLRGAPCRNRLDCSGAAHFEMVRRCERRRDGPPVPRGAATMQRRTNCVSAELAGRADRRCGRPVSAERRPRFFSSCYKSEILRSTFACHARVADEKPSRRCRRPPLQ